MRSCIVGLVFLGLSGLLIVPGAGASADSKDGTVQLFNGKDLTGFYTHFRKLGKNNDPDKVFTVHDGMIHVSGQRFGYLATEQEHANYHLTVEFKWGEKTWPPRETKARDSGVLLHAVGPDGGAGDWMQSIECQLIEGGTGDFILVKGSTLSAPVEKRGGQSYYTKGVPEQAFASGRVNWYGRDPGWKDVKGFRGAQDVEKPVGEWNVLECVCDGDQMTNILNGRVVNAVHSARPSKGKILFQSEGAEIFFRKIELKPLKK
jgi:hypothetical protein